MKNHIAIFLLLTLLFAGCKENSVKSALKSGKERVVEKTASEKKKRLPAEKVERIIKDDFYRSAEKANAFWQNSCSYFKRDELKNAELAKLNSEYWKMEKIWPSDVVNREILTSAWDYRSGNVYFLIYDNFDYKIMEMSKETRTIREKYTIPCFRNGAPSAGYAFKMAVHDGCVMIWLGNYAWCSIDGKKQMHFINEIPMFPIVSMWKSSGRIVILGENMLMSCNEKGRGRKIHFSGKQSAKTLEMQRNNPQGKFVYGTRGSDDNSAVLLFSCGFSGAQLCFYDFSENSSRIIVNLPGGEPHWFFASRNESRVFVNFVLPPQCDVSLQMSCNIADGSVQMISAVESSFHRGEVKNMVDSTKIKLEKLRRAGGALSMVNDRYLVYNGYTEPYRRMSTQGCAGVIDLKHFPDGAVLKMPSVNGIYSFDGNTLIAVEYNQITGLTPVRRE